MFHRHAIEMNNRMLMLSYLMKCITKKCSRSFKDINVKTELNKSTLVVKVIPPTSWGKKKKLRQLKQNKLILLFLANKMIRSLNAQLQLLFFFSLDVVSLDLHYSKQEPCVDGYRALEMWQVQQRCGLCKIMHTQFSRNFCLFQEIIRTKIKNLKISLTFLMLMTWKNDHIF